MRRIPLERLSERLSANRPDAKARRKFVWDDTEPHKKGHWVMEDTTIPALSTEAAKGKAIVLMPAALDATTPIEVVVFLHGFTEGAFRPYAGWRTLDTVPATTNAHLTTCGAGSTPATPRRSETSRSTRPSSSSRRAARSSS